MPGSADQDQKAPDRQGSEHERTLRNGGVQRLRAGSAHGVHDAGKAVLPVHGERLKRGQCWSQIEKD